MNDSDKERLFAELLKKAVELLPPPPDMIYVAEDFWKAFERKRRLPINYQRPRKEQIRRLQQRRKTIRL